MQTAKSKIENICSTMFILLSAWALVMLTGHLATAGYADSAHGDSVNGVNRSNAQCNEWPREECLIGSCAHCHDSFDPAICGVNERMLFFLPLDGSGGDDDFCMQCHTDTGSLQDGGMLDAPGNIETVFGKTYKHNVLGYSGLHKFWPWSPPGDAGDVEDRTYLSANKHVECNDCHNPHIAEDGLHSSNEFHVAARSNEIDSSDPLYPDAGPIKGAFGVEPTWSTSNWGGATAWPSTSSSATKEYQICFKCHSNYNTNFASWGGTYEASWTDVALEFNPSNESYHPVVQALPETDPGSNGSNRLPPSHISLLIGDSGSGQATSDCTEIFDWQGTEPAKNWAPNQWVNWGLRIGRVPGAGAPSGGYNFNAIRRIVSNYTEEGTGPYPTVPGWSDRFYLQLDAALELGSYCGSGNILYSIEYYAGRGTRSGNTVTDTYKDFNLYLPSLVGYVVVISDEYGDNVAQGTVASNDATSFTVGSWTAMYGAVPAGTVGYYFSATGQTMMCSDCHSNDTISSTAAQGPHGSAVKWMLKGRNKGWPTRRASENGTGNGDGTNWQRLYKVGLISYYDGRDGPDIWGDSDWAGLFCLNCHSSVSFSKDADGRDVWGNFHLWPFQHSQGACINCHVMVPHGSSESRLIGARWDMPDRYKFDNDYNFMYMVDFITKRTNPVTTSYSYYDCSTAGGNCHFF